MKVSGTIADCLATLGVTDVFGIPGGVILDMIYAFDAHSSITPHLTYHEQAAGFAACGYAQSSGKLGVAYATRGPGFTNLVTPMADAYYDSLPTLFMTAHATPLKPASMRVLADQEMDTCGIVRGITKCAYRIDTIDEFRDLFPKACRLALSGRKGPAFVDFSTSLLKEDIDSGVIVDIADEKGGSSADLVAELAASVAKARRPVILVGDGINQAGVAEEFRGVADGLGVPLVSSRFSHDVCCSCENYFGYVGSHGSRAANFILSKSDLIVSLGNRLHFPTQSTSFAPVLSNARVLRYEIDESEFDRIVPNSVCRHVDVASIVHSLASVMTAMGCHDDWLAVCRELDSELRLTDVSDTVEAIARILGSLPPDAMVVADVGNNEFWLSQASVAYRIPNRTLYSKSLGAMGCSLGKAIGAYYATARPMICFVGDQGLQMNIQELQYIAQHALPISIVLIDNGVSGMIRDKEIRTYGRCLHTTASTGFTKPNLPKVMQGYGIEYLQAQAGEVLEGFPIVGNRKGPVFVDLLVDDEHNLLPELCIGDECQDLTPKLERAKYEYLNKL